MRIKRVGALSVGAMFGAIYAVLGLVFGALMSMVAMFGGLAAMQNEMGGEGALFGVLFGAGAIVVLPLIYGLIGFVFGALAGLIYNLVASFVGGIRVDLVPDSGQTQPAGPVGSGMAASA